MSALAEENTGRAVELRYNDALGTIDNKGAFLGHIGNLAKIHILYLGGEILMLGVGT